MRSRLALLLALALAVPVVFFPAVSAQASGHIVIAQEEGEEEPSPAPTDGAEEESGGQEAGSAEETGPLWTYQMSRIGLVLLVLLLLGVAGAYRNFVHKRAKEGI